MTLLKLRGDVEERIDQPDRLLELIADRQYSIDVERCLPGSAEPILIYRQEDLQGLYLAGKELYRRLKSATTTEQVIELMHPDNILPAKTYQRIATFMPGEPLSATVYGPVDGGAEVYGTTDNGNVAYGVSQSGSGTTEEEQIVEDQQADNNDKDATC